MDSAEKVQVSSSSSSAQLEQRSKDEEVDPVEVKLPISSVKPLSNLSLNTHKAGMQGLDAAKVNEIIRKASEGSRFYQHKQQAQQRLDAKIQDMLRSAAGLSVEQLEKATRKMETMARQYEAERDLSRTIVHVDMDMFYAAVEMRDQPHLRSVPMAVGGNSMLSTSNYVARQYGVRAGMPGFIGRQLCPELVLVPPNFSKYKAVSKVVQEVFALYDPNYAMMSLDEAYLDITEYMAANADGYPAGGDENETLAEAIVREMRRKIQEATELTASAGIAANARLAKVCSDLNKPDGQYYLPADEGAIMDFINGLPIRKISGIGNVTEQQLKALGISLCGELRPNFGRLRLLFSESNWHYFVRISLGLGETDLTNYTGGEQKSISTETTFAGTSCRQKLLQLVSDLSVELHDDMTKKQLVGKLVTLKTKTVDFVLKTRSIPLGEPTDDPQVISNVARKLLIQEIEKCSPECPPAFRLLGVRMSNLSENNGGREKQVTISKMFQKLTEHEMSNKDGLVNELTARKLASCEDGAEVIEEPISEEMTSTSLRDSPSKKSTVFISESPKKPKYICPVCGNAVQTKFLSTFNKHIDSCLESRSETMEGAESHADVSGQSTVSLSRLDDGHDGSCDTASSDDSKAFAPEIDTKVSSCLTAHHSNSEVHSARPTSSFFASRSRSSSNKQFKSQSSCPMLKEVDRQASISISNDRYDELLCPVCNCARFSSNESLNKHLDSCLLVNASAAHPGSCSHCDDESSPDSNSSGLCHKTNTDLIDACLQPQDGHEVLATSCGNTEFPDGALSFNGSSSKSVDCALSIRSSSANLKRKIKTKITTTNKRKATGVDVPITNFFS